jgi:hypothetical protein
VAKEKEKPELVLSKAADVDALARLFEHLTGRKPTAQELADANVFDAGEEVEPGERRWRHAIREWQSGCADSVLEAIASLPIPLFAQEFLADLASGKAEPPNKGRPSRSAEDELQLFGAVLMESEQLKKSGEKDPRGEAIRKVAALKNMSPDALRGVVGKLTKKGWTLQKLERYRRDRRRSPGAGAS